MENKIMYRKFVFNAVILGLFSMLALFATSTAQAAILTPGTNSSSGLLLTAPTGSVEASLLPQVIFTPDGDQATLLTAVVEDALGGTLDFLYQWKAGPNPPNVDQFQSNSAIKFGGFATNVGYIDPAAVLSPALIALGFNAAGVGASPDFTVPTPDLVKRSAGPGNTTNWVYPTADPFHAGDQSVILIVKTNAHFWTSGVAAIIDGGSENAKSFSPMAIPEPATILIWSLLAGLGLVFAWRKRKSA
jgi:hypothetical protein